MLEPDIQNGQDAMGTRLGAGTQRQHCTVTIGDRKERKARSRTWSFADTATLKQSRIPAVAF